MARGEAAAGAESARKMLWAFRKGDCKGWGCKHGHGEEGHGWQPGYLWDPAQHRYVPPGEVTWRPE